MAKITNTLVTTDVTSNREELHNVVKRVAPEDTPIYSMMAKENSTSTHPEWLTDDLAAPAENIQPEGNEFAFGAVTPATRMGNYAQIFTKAFLVSGSQQAADNVQGVDQLKRQKLKKAIEVRKDIELSIVTNNASKGTDPRENGGLPSWLETNASRGATGADGGYDSGTGLTVAATPGTKRAFTKTLLDDTLQSVYQNGGDVKYAVMSPYNKRVFSSFMSDSNVASFRHSVDGDGKNTIVGSADIYDSDFGKVAVVPNRVTDKNDPMQSADAAARLALDNKRHLTSVLGREPTNGELYLAHQQGAGGAAKLLSNPNARAVDVVGMDAVRLNGGDANMTAGQFAQKWVSKLGWGQPQQEAPQQATGGLDPKLMQAMANPYLSDHQRNILGVIMEQKIKNAQPKDPMAVAMRKLQIQKAQQDLARGDIEINNLRNPQPKLTDDMREYEVGYRTFTVVA